MSKWASATAKERRSAPASVFCGPNRTFPVADQSDFDRAVHRLNTTKHPTGPIKACMRRKAKAGGWSMPDTWTKANMAMFAAAITMPEGWSHSDMHSFLSRELGEEMSDQMSSDAPWRTMPTLHNYDGENVYYRKGYGSDGKEYQRSYKIVQGDVDNDGDTSDQGHDAVFGPEEESVTREQHMKRADMSVTNARESDCATDGVSYAMFDAGDEQTRDDEYVVRRGVVFEAGEYADKGASFDPEDLYLATLGFQPLEARVNHASGPDRTRSYFDGKMGELRSLTQSDDGGTLLGEVAIPRWFDEFLRVEYPDDPLKISLEFDSATKMPVGLALIPNPRVESVALMSAYTAFAAEHTPIVVRDRSERERTMETPTTPQAQVLQQATTVTTNDTVSRVDFDHLAARLAAQEKREREKDADAAARKAVQEGRYTPAMFSWLKQEFLSRAEDDASAPRLITFAKSDEKGVQQTVQGTRVQAFQAMLDATPRGLYLEERIPDGGGIILPFAEDADTKKANLDQTRAAAEAYAKQINKQTTR